MSNIDGHHKLIDMTCALCGKQMKRVSHAKFCFDCLAQRQKELSTGNKYLCVKLHRSLDGATWCVAMAAHDAAIPEHEARKWRDEDPANRGYARMLVPA